MYGTDDNYWRGPVWMPIQFMILRACQKYHQSFHPEVDQTVKDNLKAVYKTVRERVIATVERNYNQTGYLYENYHKGEGNRGHPFYGWTSVVANIIAMEPDLQ